jgi:hypothetical protein
VDTESCALATVIYVGDDCAEAADVKGTGVALVGGATFNNLQ